MPPGWARAWTRPAVRPPTMSADPSPPARAGRRRPPGREGWSGGRSAYRSWVRFLSSAHAEGIALDDFTDKGRKAIVVLRQRSRDGVDGRLVVMLHAPAQCVDQHLFGQAASEEVFLLLEDALQL